MLRNERHDSDEYLEAMRGFLTAESWEELSSYEKQVYLFPRKKALGLTV